jgi:hypothetical protein
VGEWNSCDRELVYAGFALAQHLPKGCVLGRLSLQTRARQRGTQPKLDHGNSQRTRILDPNPAKWVLTINRSRSISCQPRSSPRGGTGLRPRRHDSESEPTRPGTLRSQRSAGD